jgi:hypothetical protein
MQGGREGRKGEGMVEFVLVDMIRAIVIA